MSNNPFEPPHVDPQQSVQEFDYDGKKRSIIIKLFAYYVFLGVVVGIFPDDLGIIDFIIQLPVLYWCLSWCFTDAKQHGHRIGGIMRIALVLFFIIAFPIYLLETRGIAGFKAIAITVVLASALLACMMTVAIATMYTASLLGLQEWPT